MNIQIGNKVKFNNSRSNKFPYWVYGEVVEGNTFTTLTGLRFDTNVLSSGVTIVSDEEFEKVKQSEIASREFIVGDTVIQTDYASIKKRTGVVLEIYTFDKGNANEHERAKLSNGEDISVRELRKESVLIYKS